ncbi:MAG: hypothetical protein VCC01_02635 [Candidatus Hydrogenedentota bacterium]
MNAAIEVHRTLGVQELLESMYEEALHWEPQKFRNECRTSSIIASSL